MRKLFAFILVICLIVLFCSCNFNTNQSNTPSSSTESSSSGTVTTDLSTGTAKPDTSTTDSVTDTNDPRTSTTESGTSPSEPAEINKEYMLSVIENIYKAAEGSVYKGYYLSDLKDEMIKQGAISEKSSARYFGTSLEYVFAVYSESNQEAVAYSMCLLRAKDGANIEQIKMAIQDNANPNKWECVTAEKVVVESNGKYVILIMADTAEADSLKAAFLSLNLG